MASTCLCFELHSPQRLRHYTAFDAGNDYFDRCENGKTLRDIVRQYYLPANALLLKLIEKHQGRFRLAFGMTGVLLEQLRDDAPEALESFQALAETGCVEFLARTYQDKLFFPYSPSEFSEQVGVHKKLTRQLFGQDPQVFLSTERVYSNALAAAVEHIGSFDAIVIDAAEPVAAQFRCGYIHIPPYPTRIKLLLKNHCLSDDLARLFSGNTTTLRPDSFAWTKSSAERGAVETICIDYATLGACGGNITDAMEHLRSISDRILEHPCGKFKTPGDVARSYEALDVLDAPETAAGTEDQASGGPEPDWLDNPLQQDAAAELRQLESAIRAAGNVELLASWRRLQSRHHFARMDTRRQNSADLSAPAAADESPYDAYISFMNVLTNLKDRCVSLATIE